MTLRTSFLPSMQRSGMLVRAGVRRTAGARGGADRQPRRHRAHDHGAVRPAQPRPLPLCVVHSDFKAAVAHAHHGKSTPACESACHMLRGRLFCSAAAQLRLSLLVLIRKCLSSHGDACGRRQKQAGLLASATALREAADRRVVEAELGCERRLDDLEASLKVRPVACVLATLTGGTHAADVAVLCSKAECAACRCVCSMTVRCTPLMLCSKSRTYPLMLVHWGPGRSEGDICSMQAEGHAHQFAR